MHHLYHIDFIVDHWFIQGADIEIHPLNNIDFLVDHWFIQGANIVLSSHTETCFDGNQLSALT